MNAWRVLAGRAPNDLSPVTTRARHGFETSIAISPHGPDIVVQALDRNANVLSATEPLTV